MATHAPATLLAVKKHICSILDISQQNTGFQTRLDEIDVQYARYQAAVREGNQAGIDTYGQKNCGADKDIINPVVISQVDSMVAYWAEVFLSGYPIFPVVSTPENKSQAEALEGIIQDHITMTESVPELQLVLRDAGKYNFYAVEPDWAPLQTYKPFRDLADMGGTPTAPEEAMSYVNYINRLNPRNVHWDRRIPLTKVDSEGDFVGYTKIYTRMGLKNLLNRLSQEKTLVSPKAVNLALSSAYQETDFREDPIITDWANGEGANQRAVNYDVYGGYIPALPEGMRKVPENAHNTYAVHTFYLRLIPSDFAMMGIPNKNSVQVWKVRMVNRSVVISLEPYTGAMGRLGIFLGVAIEDGLDTQTQSYAELASGIQDATSRLFNIRFKSAKRAIADRALYNPDLIRASDANSPFPSAKIPVKAGKLSEQPLSSAYMQIPFDMRGTEGALQDALLINEWQKELTGQNSATRGQFTKGNRTLGEFDTIMGNSEARLRLPNIVIEHRMMAKIKEALKLNLLMYGEDTIVISPRTGMPVALSIQSLQQHRMEFEIADGYMPKGKLVNTELLMQLMQMITQSPQLQGEIGYQLPSMLSHVAQLAGVRGFDRYAAAAEKDAAHNITGMMATQQAIMAAVQQLQQQAGQQPMQDPNQQQQAQPKEGEQPQ